MRGGELGLLRGWKRTERGEWPIGPARLLSSWARRREGKKRREVGPRERRGFSIYYLRNLREIQKAIEKNSKKD